jgi:hypothetical protein
MVRRTMQRAAAVLLPLAGALVVVTALTACGGNSNASTTKTSPTTTAAAAAAPRRAATPKTAASAPAWPQITSISPTAGPVGTAVTITGTGLADTTGVWIGIHNFSPEPSRPSAQFGVISDTELTMIVSPDSWTAVIDLQTLVGSASSPGYFAVVPTVSSISPTSGPPGTLVTIRGTGFNSVHMNDVFFKDSSQAATSEQALRAQTVNCTGCKHEMNQIILAVPSAAATGKIRLMYSVNPQTQVMGSVYTATFTVTPPPVKISSFSPKHAPTGTTITITGSGLSGATTVTIGGAEVTYTVVSDTSITFVVPPTAKSGYIQVTNSHINGAGRTAYAYGFVVEPRVTSFSPKTGAAGTVVTITGTGLAGTTRVAFNGGNGTILSATPTTVRVSVPEGVMSGPITVTTAGNYTSVAPGTFTLRATPT